MGSADGHPTRGPQRRSRRGAGPVRLLAPPAVAPAVVLAVVLTVALGIAPGIPLLGVDAVGARQEPAPAEPAAVRDQVRDVMSGSEYDYSPSILERVGDWIGEQLRRLFGDPSGPEAGGTFGGGIGELLGWVVIVGAVVAIAAVVVWLVLNRTRRSSAADEPEAEAEVEHRRRASEWLEDAERLEAAGEWKAALRARFRHLVRTLVDRRQLPDVPGRTTGELRVDLARTTPGAAEAFETCCVLFELAWYAGVPTGSGENDRIRAASRDVFGAAVVERYDRTLLADDAGAGTQTPDDPGAPDRPRTPHGTDLATAGDRT